MYKLSFNGKFFVINIQFSYWLFNFCHLCKFFFQLSFFHRTMSEKYNLNWQSFSEHLQLMFKDLHQEGRYTDVTLISDDQTQYKAHKIVLSACSPVFRKIIDSNPSQHPLIYLRGVQSYEKPTFQ